MLPLAFYLLTSSVYAADYINHFEQPLPIEQNYGAASFPMDYNDDIHNRRLMINDSNLIFNYKQFRRDQPPQVEQREENIGKYRYRKPKPTTSSRTELQFDSGVIQEIHPLPRLPTLKSVENNNPHKWNQMNASTIPPPPSTPEWADLSLILGKQKASQHQTQPKHETTQAPDSNKHVQPIYLPHYQSHIPSPPLIATHWGKIPTRGINVKQNLPDKPAIPLFQNYIPPTIVQQTHSQISQLVKDKSVKEPVISQATQPTSSRGNHKFSWNDVVTPKMTTTTTTSSNIGLQKRNTPPSVPTLSPWFDGFRK